jgi:hypothetical protein
MERADGTAMSNMVFGLSHVRLHLKSEGTPESLLQSLLRALLLADGLYRYWSVLEWPSGVLT